MPAVDLADRARQQDQSETKEEVIEATTAFLIYVRKDTGQIVMTHDINAPVVAERGPNHDEVYGTLQVIIKDLVANQNAGLTAQAVMQMQQALMQQAMQQQSAEADPNVQEALKSFQKTARRNGRTE
jgi:hypothetical protein